MAKFSKLVEFHNFVKAIPDANRDAAANALTDCVKDMGLSDEQLDRICGHFLDSNRLLATFFEHSIGSYAFKDFLKKEVLAGQEPE